MSKKQNEIREMIGNKNKKSSPEKSEQAKSEVMKSLGSQESKEERKKPRKVERKKTNLELNADLHKEFRILSLREDRPMYELLDEAMEAYLKNREKD